MTRSVHPDAIPVIAVTAQQEARRYWGFLESSDLAQVGHEWCLRHPRKTKEYLECDDPKQGARLLSASLRGEMQRAGERDRATALGYKVSDLHYYTLDQLRKEILPAIFDRQSWTSPPGEGSGGKSTTSPSERGNWIAMLADVADGYRKLPEEQRELLRFRHAYDYTVKDVAEIWGLSEAVIEKRITSAEKKLHHILGGDRPRSCDDGCECRDNPRGRRRTRSNASAQAITSNQTGA